MSKNNNKLGPGSGNRIRGKMNPFLTEPYKAAREKVLGRSEAYNDYYAFRTICKNQIVDRCRVAVQRLNFYEMLPVEQIQDYLKNSGYTPKFVHFMECLCSEYNDVNECIYFVDRAACRESTDEHSMIQFAVQDVKKLMSSDVAKVMRRLQEVKTMQTTEYEEITAKYQRLKEGGNVFTDMFKTIYDKEIPNRLAKPDYELVLSLDARLESLYKLDRNHYWVTEKFKKPVYRMLNYDAAAMLALIMVVGSN